MIGQSLHLYDYHIWANERVIRHLQTLPEEVFTKEVKLGFQSIAHVLGHLVSADAIWFARIKEESGAPQPAKPFENIEEAIRCMNELQSNNREYLLSISDFERNVTYRNAMGHEFRNTVSEILQQVVNHGTYHRGNITTILRSLGFAGIQTDYIAYLRK